MFPRLRTPPSAKPSPRCWKTKASFTAGTGWTSPRNSRSCTSAHRSYRAAMRKPAGPCWWKPKWTRTENNSRRPDDSGRFVATTPLRSRLRSEPRALASGCRLPAREVGFGGSLVFERCHLVGIDPDDQVADVVVDAGEPVAHARGNHDDVARLQVVRDAAPDRRTVASGSIQVAHVVV